MRHTLSIETTTHGRILVEDAADVVSPRLLVTFHGYGQSARTILEEVARIPGIDAWRVASVQGLHRFYTRDDQSVVASWMTREDREQAIADNLGYVNRVVRAALPGAGDEATVVFLGFSQGVAMAYRAAVMGERRAGGLIAIGGDVPPDVKEASSDRFPPILIAGGASDEWYTAAKLEADEVFLRGRGLPHEIFRYAGGHVWTAELRGRVHQVLDKLT